MPTFDDAQVIPAIVGTDVVAGDKMYIYDVSAKMVKTITIAELIVALDALDEGALATDA